MINKNCIRVSGKGSFKIRTASELKIYHLIYLGVSEN